MKFINELYISCGCNRTPHAADWGINNKICFASCNSVGLFNPMDKSGQSRIEKLLNIHSARVTAVRWLRDSRGKTVDVILSTSADKTAVLTSNFGNETYLKEAVAEGHENTVSVADGIIHGTDTEYIPNKTLLTLATASADSSVRLWTRGKDSGALECKDVLQFGTGFALDVRLAVIACSVLLACAVDDCRVHLFSPNASGKYEKVHVISGHEDWVRALDFCWNGEKLFLATASQDTFVRVYEFGVKKKVKSEAIGLKTKPIFVQVEETEFSVGGNLVGVRLDTVLLGHESWVYGVSFHSSPRPNGSLKLLTTSMDKSLVVWSSQGGLWLETVRVGEVGGNTLGFYGGKFSPDGQGIMAHGYLGSFHIWRCTKNNSWEPQVVAGGHLGDVLDLSWSPSGRYLLSVSADQTTRLHAPWCQNNMSTWHEIARPQVHGHDLSCIASITDTSFVSGAEEKVLRAFQAPMNFLKNFRQICRVDVSDATQGEAPEGAAVPALGLSNKPVYDVAQSEKDIGSCFSPLHLNRPPTEENLVQNTLWPETQKLYGHGYEVHCVAASPDGNAIASACHASNTEHASIIVWDTRTWGQIQKLTFHRLTVTQIKFSPNGGYLLTVSRDRRFCLYRREINSGLYSCHVAGEKTPHSRIIWCCAWTQDGGAFSTGSRDGVICVWDPNTGECLHQANAGDSVTALAFAEFKDDKGPLLLAGTDSGLIVIYVWADRCLHRVHEFFAHSDTVRRIQFRPGHEREFATGSKDFSVRIFRISSTISVT